MFIVWTFFLAFISEESLGCYQDFYIMCVLTIMMKGLKNVIVFQAWLHLKSKFEHILWNVFFMNVFLSKCKRFEIKVMLMFLSYKILRVM